MFRIEISRALVSCPRIGKSRKVPALNGPPLKVSRYVRQVPHASAVSLAATHSAGAADVEAGLMVTTRLNRLFALWAWIRGSVSVSELRSSRLSVTPPPHSTDPRPGLVTWMKVLTSSTVSPPLVAALGSGGTQPEQAWPWLMPSRFRTTAGAANGRTVPPAECREPARRPECPPGRPGPGRPGVGCPAARARRRG